ncbi:MAG: ATP-binding protein [Anaerolineaceae bacterium]|nr:ATP-binding protein [Anaerolineaceae bacterium]
MSNNSKIGTQIKIAVASGKGGTGKTTIATSLAKILQSEKNILIDCDVEAPNAHIFLKPQLTAFKDVSKAIPVIDKQKCTYCGKCAHACKFNAISISAKSKVALTFPNLCHACGVCSYVCPENAITEKSVKTGVLAKGNISSNLVFANGHLEIGAAIATPVIHSLKKWAMEEHTYQTILFDSPPGTSCSVVETLRDADFVLLVTEPTPFGLHDLKLTIKLVQNLGKPAGIIINRDGIGQADIESLSNTENIPILARIPLRRDIAESLSEGNILIEAFPEFTKDFNRILDTVEQTIHFREGK